MSGLFYIFSFQWRKDFIHLLILVPEIQLARSDLGVFSVIPFFPSDLLPRNVHFSISISIDFIFYSFQNGLFNSLFFVFPRSLSFLVILRRYWLQGFKVGTASTIGYRRGETFFLVRVANGFRPLWWTTNSFFSFSVGLFITGFILWESFSYYMMYSHNLFSFKSRGKTSFLKNNIGQTVIISSFKSRYLFFVIFTHFLYSYVESGTFFGTFINQTCNIREFFGNLLLFSYFSKIRYGIGLFWGGLFFDFFFRIIAFVSFEMIFSKLRHPPTEWKQTFHKLTSCFILSFSFRRIPYYSSDYLLFSSMGFFGRDTELSRRVSQNAFSYSIRPGIPLSILFEGRNIIGEDCYGRSSPDILHEPLVMSRLAIEPKRDVVDETYRTQQTNQRVDSIYLGTLERKIFEWLSVRNSKRLRLSQIESNQDSIAAILVKEPIRRDVGLNVTPRSNSLIHKFSRVNFERSEERFIRWFRIVRYIKSGEDKSFFSFPMGYSRKPPESLFALFASDFSQQSYLASIGILEPQRVVRYSSSSEFARKRNARRSPLHRGPIFRYIDLFLKTRSKVKGFCNDISSRQQQCDLYRARRILHNYVAFSRHYSEVKRVSTQTSSELRRRIIWHNKFHSFLFGGNRSRFNSIYSQQYIGNLQLVRRLFSISWYSNENVIPFRIQFNEKQQFRRKIALDQCAFDFQKNIFEHEELGKVFPIRNQCERKRILIPDFRNSSDVYINVKMDVWIKKRSFPDFRVETIPLYVGWDSQQRVIILCNRFFPKEWTSRVRFFDKIVLQLKLVLENFEFYYLNRNCDKLKSWPKNFQIRCIRLRGVRYNIRALLQRRVPRSRKSFLLSSDRRNWNRGSSSTFVFWFNPRSDLQRENIERSHNPTRGSQRFPFSLERRIFSETYIPGNLQPVSRGGFTWPETDLPYFTQKNYLL